MFDLLRRLRSLMPLGDLFDLLKAIIGIGLPPDPCEEGEFKLWIAKLLDALLKVAGVTPTELDDNAVAVLKTAMESDDGWSLLYSVVMLFDPHDDGPVFGANVEAGNAPVVALADKVGMDPATIIVIVKTIMELVKWWRNR